MFMLVVIALARGIFDHLSTCFLSLVVLKLWLWSMIANKAWERSLWQLYTQYLAWVHEGSAQVSR